MNLDLTGKTVLVTGGSRGIGAAIVAALLDSGAAVALHFANSRAAAERIAARAPDRCRLLQADLGDVAAATRLWNEAASWRGGIDVVVNNAALVTPATMDDDCETWLAAWRNAMNVNVLAVAVLCRHAVSHFSGRKGGIVINIASRAAFRGDDPHLIHYAASKGAVVALTRSIARGYAHRNVLAYLVAPGFVRTERQEGVIAARGEAAMIRDIPLGEMASSSDIAPIVVFLASGAARHATGATIDINGASYFH
ncbi:MAG: SDR family NAD(P)-dependent oxidoreductase [Parvibaculaceae bacterium]